MKWEDVEPGLSVVENWSTGPFNAHVGLELFRWGPGAAEGRLDVREFHANWLGVAHGGVSMTALDFAMGMSGCYAPDFKDRRACMTLSMSTNFVAPVQTGPLVVRGWVTGGGCKTFFPTGEIRDDKGKLLVSATGVFRYVSAQPVKP